jgi:poly(U)-specific endoribonuclease
MEAILKLLCCGSDDNSDTHSKTNQVGSLPADKITRPPKTHFATLNDIPLGDWQDTNGHKPPVSPGKPPSITSSATSASSPASLAPTSEELRNHRLACEKLWNLDSNRLNPGLDFEMYYQLSTNASSPTEKGRNKLFRYVNEPRIFTIPTYKYFYDLLDNYTAETGITENHTPQEIKEQELFLKAFCNTKPGQYLHQYLVALRLCSGDPTTFQEKLQEIWFSPISRDGKADSSAFEHVFLGETREGEVIGFHNWLYMYFEEKFNRLEYKGYVKPKGSHPLENPTGKEHLTQVKFEWRNAFKPVSSAFIGTSPEFELALYTLLFLVEKHKVSASFDGIETEVVIHSFESRGVSRLGSCYPTIKC